MKNIFYFLIGYRNRAINALEFPDFHSLGKIRNSLPELSVRRLHTHTIRFQRTIGVYFWNEWTQMPYHRWYDTISVILFSCAFFSSGNLHTTEMSHQMAITYGLIKIRKKNQFVGVVIGLRRACVSSDRQIWNKSLIVFMLLTIEQSRYIHRSSTIFNNRTSFTMAIRRDCKCNR